MIAVAWLAVLASHRVRRETGFEGKRAGKQSSIAAAKGGLR
jgi:hypothetical protein